MSYAKYYEKGTLTPTVNTISSDSDSSPNWAGYVIQSTPNNGTIYSQAWGDWTQPPAVSGTRPACWVGVGGYTQPNFVVQAGAIPIRRVCQVRFVRLSLQWKIISQTVRCHTISLFSCNKWRR